MTDWAKIVEVLKLAPKAWAALTLSAGSILLVPADWLVGLGLRELATQYRPWVGAVLVLSVAMLITHAAFAGWETLTSSRRKRSALTELKRVEREDAENVCSLIQKK